MFEGNEVEGDAEAQIVMGVHAGLRFRLEYVVHRLETVGHAVEQQGARGIGDIDAVRAVILHQLGLFGEALGLVHMGQHQQTGDIHAEIARDLDMLLGNIGFGAMGRDPHRTGPRLIGVLQVFHRADTGQQQDGEDGIIDNFGRRLDPFEIGLGAKAVIERSAGQPVAMGDFDAADAGLVERAGDLPDLVERIAVADGMHAVAQRGVLNVNLAVRVHIHDQAAFLSSTRRSAVASAAEVMMSRLPA